jgi:heme-degrading monooxygenase HmoA
VLLRVFQADVRRGHEAVFFARLRTHLSAETPAIDGVQSVRVGRQMSDAGEKVVVISTWRDFASLQRAVGKDWLRSYFLPDDLRELVENVEVRHYEVVAELPATGEGPISLPA